MQSSQTLYPTAVKPRQHSLQLGQHYLRTRQDSLQPREHFIHPGLSWQTLAQSARKLASIGLLGAAFCSVNSALAFDLPALPQVLAQVQTTDAKANSQTSNQTKDQTPNQTLIAELKQYQQQLTAAKQTWQAEWEAQLQKIAPPTQADASASYADQAGKHLSQLLVPAKSAVNVITQAGLAGNLKSVQVQLPELQDFKSWQDVVEFGFAGVETGFKVFAPYLLQQYPQAKQLLVQSIESHLVRPEYLVDPVLELNLDPIRDDLAQGYQYFKLFVPKAQDRAAMVWHLLNVAFPTVLYSAVAPESEFSLQGSDLKAKVAQAVDELLGKPERFNLDKQAVGNLRHYLNKEIVSFFDTYQGQIGMEALGLLYLQDMPKCSTEPVTCVWNAFKPQLQNYLDTAKLAVAGIMLNSELAVIKATLTPPSKEQLEQEAKERNARGDRDPANALTLPTTPHQAVAKLQGLTADYKVALEYLDQAVGLYDEFGQEIDKLDHKPLKVGNDPWLRLFSTMLQQK